MKLLTKIIVVIFFLFSEGLLFAGGGWPQKKGEGFFKLSEWWIVADKHYTDVGLLDPNITNKLFTTAFYGEYGFTDRLTGILYAPVFSRNVNNNLVSSVNQEILMLGEAISGIGDTDVAIKYGLNKAGSTIALAATLKLGIPLGKTGGGSQGNLQLGDGEFNQLLQIDAGTSKSLGEKTTFYANAYAGFNNRTNDFSDEIRLGLEAGIGIMNKKLWAIARLDVLRSLKNGALSSEITSTSVFANNTEYTSIGGELNYYLTKKVGLSVGAATAINGKIILAAPSFSVGVFLDMK